MSESSNSSVITKEEIPLKRAKNRKNSSGISVLKPGTFIHGTCNTKAYGIADMMAHIFERYFTNTKDVLLTDELCEAVLRTIIKSGSKMLFNSQDYASHAILCGQAPLRITILWQPAGGLSCHGIAHGISARFGAAHGATLAVLFPFWMLHQLHHDVERFYRFAVKVMGVDEQGNHEAAAIEGINKLRTFFDSLGLPHSLKTFGVTEEALPELVDDVKLNDEGTIGFFKPLTKEDILAIYKAALK